MGRIIDLGFMKIVLPDKTDSTLDSEAARLANKNRQEILDGNKGRAPTPEALAQGKKLAKQKQAELNEHNASQRESLW